MVVAYSHRVATRVRCRGRAPHRHVRRTRPGCILEIPAEYDDFDGEIEEYLQTDRTL